MVPLNFFRKKKPKQKIPVSKKIKNVLLAVVGWSLVSQIFNKIVTAWLRLAERDRDLVENDTFELACQRHEISPEQLLLVTKKLRTNKRSYWFLTWVSFYFWLMGTGLLFFQGVSLSRMNMALASLGLMALFTALCFKYEFRVWQCETHRLGNLDEFWAAGGGWRILKW